MWEIDNMTTITMPDFRRWAERLVMMRVTTGLMYDMPMVDIDEVEKALRQAFDQGRSLGHREGSETHEPGYRGAF
jgi:hypothetical protein